jgi:hypothetical protein
LELTSASAKSLQRSQLNPVFGGQNEQGSVRKQSALRMASLLFALSASSACRSTPTLTFAQIRYETPAGEVCKGGAAGRSSLDVQVQDEEATPLPGASVFAGEVGTTSTSALLTNDTGIARLELPGDKPYAVTAVLEGFAPVSRGLRLRSGCEGRLVIVLKVGPVIDLER